MRILDKNRTEITQGARLSVTRCIGRYGQTQTDIGTVEAIDTAYRGVTLKLEHESRNEFKGAVSYLKPGDLRYISLPGQIIGTGPDAVFIALRKFDDFEHGHTAFAEVLPG